MLRKHAESETRNDAPSISRESQKRAEECLQQHEDLGAQGSLQLSVRRGDAKALHLLPSARFRDLLLDGFEGKRKGNQPTWRHVHIMGSGIPES